MLLKRSTKTKLAVVTSLALQIITIICGIIVPRIMIGAYGSELYGATTSILQFLAYISLLEGGIGGVARAALYKHIASCEEEKTSKIYHEIKRFFNIIAIIFIAYTLVVASTYKYMARVEFIDWTSTFLLVVAISISSLAQYFIGFPNQVLVQADQRTYIVNVLNIITAILNTVLTIVLIFLGCNIIIVKLVSSCVYTLRPLFLQLYVRCHYRITKTEREKETILKDKWVGLGQHIAFFLHSNTDTVVLTLLADLKTVAVYSVYYMIISHIRNIVSVLTSGMEALFGDMLARNEKENLSNTFDFYDTLISFVSVVIFSVTAVLIIPFVKLYTADITDANYIQPIFSILLISGEFVYCLRSPFHNLIIAAGRFRQTQAAAYLEAAMNVILSCALVFKFGLVGVAVGTLVSFLFRYIYYVFYLSKHIIYRKISRFVKRTFVNSAAVLFVFFIGNRITGIMSITNYGMWCVAGVIVTAVSFVICAIINILFYRNDMFKIYAKVKKKREN